MNPHEIIFLENEDIDKKEWDKAVSESVNGLIYCYSWYLDIVCPGWMALATANYDVIFPLTARKKLRINYLFPPYFTQQLGLFFKHPDDEKLFPAFLKKASEKFSYIEININAQNKTVPASFNPKKNLNHILDLSPAYQSLSAKYSENLRRNLKKSAAANLQIKFNEEISALITLFRKNKGMAISNLKDKDYHVLQKLANTCVKKGQAFCYGVYSKNSLIAGAFFLKDNQRIIFLFSANSEKGKEVGAIPFLINYVIQKYAAQNMLFDFEGSNDSNLARFYKGFGSSESVYLQIKKNRLPLPLRLIKK